MVKTNINLTEHLKLQSKQHLKACPILSLDKYNLLFRIYDKVFDIYALIDPDCQFFFHTWLNCANIRDLTIRNCKLDFTIYENQPWDSSWETRKHRTTLNTNRVGLKNCRRKSIHPCSHPNKQNAQQTNFGIFIPRYREIKWICWATTCFRNSGILKEQNWKEREMKYIFKQISGIPNSWKHNYIQEKTICNCFTSEKRNSIAKQLLHSP